ncbi:FkbM family methyltransferase [Acidobacterium sp. S8]|uniref:FkbM family methyltransferase n=1 Tax=Acidobacterium sp. S8 TaxID=1641854 RepID=UPI00131C8A1F|nr:FkbM family methyltransferase [Acidobacterium sp. S8]
MNIHDIPNFYAYLFARKKFYRFNRILFNLSLRGLGILNYKNDIVSGERRFLERQLQKVIEPIVLDVGANVGAYSCAVLSSNSRAKVFAFEPHPNTFKRLSERVVPLGIRVFNVACGSATGSMTLYDYGFGGTEHASLYQEVIEELHNQQPNRHDVEVIDLDSFTTEHQIDHIDLLKIDAEGHELQVLQGAEGLIRRQRVRAIHFEFNEMNVVSRTFLRDYYKALPKYKLYRMLRDGLIAFPDKYSPTFSEIFAFQNIVAIPRQSIQGNSEL